MPNMGTSAGAVRSARGQGLADALFSSTQQRVLGLIFGQPDRSFYATELIGLVGSGSGAVQRELARLEQSGLVTVKRVGTQKHYQANPDSPVFAELSGIVRKTVGLAAPLRQALAPFVDQIVAAFVYGSIAKRQETSASDIDLLIVSDTLHFADLYSALEPVGTRLGRAINPTIYNRKQWARRVQGDSAFIKRVLEQPKLWVIGTDDALTA